MATKTEPDVEDALNRSVADGLLASAGPTVGAVQLAALRRSLADAEAVLAKYPTARLAIGYAEERWTVPMVDMVGGRAELVPAHGTSESHVEICDMVSGARVVAQWPDGSQGQPPDAFLQSVLSHPHMAAALGALGSAKAVDWHAAMVSLDPASTRSSSGTALR